MINHHWSSVTTIINHHLPFWSTIVSHFQLRLTNLGYKKPTLVSIIPLSVSFTPHHSMINLCQPLNHHQPLYELWHNSSEISPWGVLLLRQGSLGSDHCLTLRENCLGPQSLREVLRVVWNACSDVRTCYFITSPDHGNAIWYKVRPSTSSLISHLTMDISVKLGSYSA